MSSFDDENSSTSTSSSSVTMAKPVLLRASMLRPSAFSAQLFGGGGNTTTSASSTTASTWPAMGLKMTDGEKAEEEAKATVEDDAAPKEELEKDKEPAGDPLKLLAKSNGLAKSNPFTAVQVTPLSTDSGFVFGQNTRDRVTGNVEEEQATPATKSNGDLSFSNTPKEEENGSGAAASGSTADEQKEKGGEGSSGKSLSDVAREYEENKNARKRKFEEVETFTGEEDEINVLDITCKLYTFAQVYEERGRGSLRLNDPKKGNESSSRLVFRTAGSLRVLLNTKIWDGMIAEPASAKSLRITGIDTTGHVKVYLVMARPSDIQSLAMALNLRIAAEKTKVKQDVDATNGSCGEKVTPDLIADTEGAVGEGGVEGQEEDQEVESVSVEVPALKRRAVDPDSSSTSSTSVTETTTTAAKPMDEGAEGSEAAEDSEKAKTEVKED